MDQIGTAVAADAINKVIVAPLLQQINDVIHLVQNRGLLQAKIERMELFLRDIRNAFENQQRTVPGSIQHCLDSTGVAIEEAKSLIDRSQPQKRCLDCIFCKPRISRRIRECNSSFYQNLQELQTLFLTFASAQQIASSSAPPPAKELLQPLPEWGLVGMDIKSAETQLQTWLTEGPQLRRIGVYGMAGVGKTTLLKSVYNFYKVSDVFEVVIWVTVSQNVKISDMQGCIAEVINLDLSKTSDFENRKMMLSASLNKKKFLLMLDDMWSHLDLQQELGVAFGTDKCSKVVFSTRNRDLALKAERSIKVEPLSRDEGWALFQRVAFRGGLVPEYLKESARNISDECEGLPLALTVVAATMTDKTQIDEWNYYWSLMKNVDSSFPDTHPRVDEKLYQRLRCSYDDLSKTPHLQNCFLYCAMYPEDQEIHVEKLVIMWIAEGFIKTKEATYSTDMQLGHRYVKLLIDRCLFQNGNFEKQSMDIVVNKPVNVRKWRYITVHDVIRDMAIYIGEKEENYLCSAGQQLEDFPHNPTQDDCKRMSLCNNEIKSLPNRDFQCPKLVSLLLSQNPLSCNVPESFLINLTSLRVLDLSHTRIESVPTSLTQLRYLDLSYTRIESVPTSLTQLALLQFLDLSGTVIKELPEGLGNLAQLQYLNLRGCESLVSLPCSIGKLKQLQFLDLCICLRLVLPPELSQVTSLRRIYLMIGLNEAFTFNWSEMKHLHLTYGWNHDLHREIQNMKKLQSFSLHLYKGVNLPNWIYEFQQLERLELFDCYALAELPSLERLPNLKFLKIAICHKVKDLGIGSSGDPSGFPMLQMLVLKEMKNLQSLTGPSCEGGVLKEGTLPKLRVLKIVDCPALKKLPMGMEKLPNLTALYGQESWWENVIWEDTNMKICLDKVFRIKEV